jgi:hypothetical protein
MSVIKRKRGLSEGSPLREDDLVHLSLARFEHNCPLGQDHTADLDGLRRSGLY